MIVFINPEFDESGRRILKVMLVAAICVGVIAIVLAFLGALGLL